MKPFVKSGIQVFERLELEALVREKLKIKNFKLTTSSISQIKNPEVKEFAFLLLALEETIKQDDKDSIKEAMKYIKIKNKLNEWKKNWDPSQDSKLIEEARERRERKLAEEGKENEKIKDEAWEIGLEGPKDKKMVFSNALILKKQSTESEPDKEEGDPFAGFEDDDFKP